MHIHCKYTCCTHLLYEVNDFVNPFEGGAAVAEPHGPPEVDRVQHQVSGTKVELVSHGEVLLCPDKVPVSSTDSFQQLIQQNVAISISAVVWWWYLHVCNSFIRAQGLHGIYCSALPHTCNKAKYGQCILQFSTIMTSLVIHVYLHVATTKFR